MIAHRDRRCASTRERPEDRAQSPSTRRREIAALFARAVMRVRRCEKSARIIDAQKSRPGRETGLELSGGTPLSVGTRGLWPRADGDEP